MMYLKWLVVLCVQFHGYIWAGFRDLRRVARLPLHFPLKGSDSQSRETKCEARKTDEGALWI